MYTKLRTAGLVVFFAVALTAYGGQQATVQRVVDGDTFVLTTGEKVRMIGIDSPEEFDPDKPVEYFSDEARAYLDTMISGKQVRLEFGTERTDKYGRLLCYVYLPDSTFVNLQMVQWGYAMAYLRFPHQYEDQFLKAELSARRAAIGMWASPRSRPATKKMTAKQFLDQKEPPQQPSVKPVPAPAPTSETVYITRTGAKYHRAGCSSLRKSMIPITKEEAIARGYGACQRCRP